MLVKTKHFFSKCCCLSQHNLKVHRTRHECISNKEIKCNCTIKNRNTHTQTYSSKYSINRQIMLNICLQIKFSSYNWHIILASITHLSFFRLYFTFLQVSTKTMWFQKNRFWSWNKIDNHFWINLAVVPSHSCKCLPSFSLRY